MTHFSNIGIRLADLRVELFGSRGKAKMAREIGISDSLYGCYERGTMPPPTVLAKIAEIGNVRLEWLVTGKGARKPENKIIILPNVPLRSLTVYAGNKVRPVGWAESHGPPTGVYRTDAIETRSVVPIIKYGVQVQVVQNKHNIPGENLFAHVFTEETMAPIVHKDTLLIIDPDMKLVLYGLVAYRKKAEYCIHCAFLLTRPPKDPEPDFQYVFFTLDEKIPLNFKNSDLEWVHPVVGT